MKKFLISCVVVNPQNLVGFFNLLRGLIFVVSLTATDLFAGSHLPDSLWKKAFQYEQLFDDKRALQCYLQILSGDPHQIEALVKASRLYSRIGGRKQKGASKKDDITKAQSLALRAIQLSPANIEARFQYVISLGLLAEMADSPREKLENARIIKRETDLVLSLDENHPGAHYVLGKWHQSLSSLSWIERLACETLFGGVPEGASLAEADRNLKRAVDLTPDFILFHLGLARLRIQQAKYSEAIAILTNTLRMPESEPDDIIRKDNCKRILLELQLNTHNPKQ